MPETRSAAVDQPALDDLTSFLKAISDDRYRRGVRYPQWFRCHCRVVEQFAISGRDGQTPSDHNSTTYFLNRLNFPTPTWSTVMQVLGNGAPGAVGQGRIALFPGLEVPWINRAGEIRQRVSGWTKSEFDGSGCLSAVGAGLEH